ncbi:MAG: nicotinate (nicotinamide) nucleotide adenylyltransferase [Pseudomonadota bacterium]
MTRAQENKRTREQGGGKNIAIFGGSFDPPHMGHLFVSLYVYTCFNIDETWILPCFSHPLEKKYSSSYNDRLKMCKLAFSNLKKNKIKVLDTERKLASSDKKNYTIDTVQYLKKQNSNNEFYLIIGDDILNEAYKWKDFEQLSKLVNIILIKRHLKIKKRNENFTNFALQMPKVSSSNIRELIFENIEIDGLVCNEVKKYIKEKKLYLKK